MSPRVDLYDVLHEFAIAFYNLEAETKYDAGRTRDGGVITTREDFAHLACLECGIAELDILVVVEEVLGFIQLTHQLPFESAVHWHICGSVFFG